MFTHQSQRSSIKSDAQLDHLAAQYHANPKLHTRVTFAEFITQPEHFLTSAESWPEREWSVQFVACGSHHKMWVNNHLTGETLRVEQVRKDEYQTIIGKLDAITKHFGKPNAVLVDPSTGYHSDTARAWCRLNGISILHPRKDRPQLVDAFGGEAA